MFVLVEMIDQLLPGASVNDHHAPTRREGGRKVRSITILPDSGEQKCATVMTEGVVRSSLRAELLASAPPSAEAIYEFWVPQSNERADVAVIGAILEGFEIKTERDSLKRLPRQADAYTRVFDRCHAVLAERHVERAMAILPSWWGILVIEDSLSFRLLRHADANDSVDPETLVRLLWRDEALAVLRDLGVPPDPRAGRYRMWELLLAVLDLTSLKRVVREALLVRDRSARTTSRVSAVT